MSDIALRVLTRNGVNKTPKLAKIESGRSFYQGSLYPTVDVLDDESILPEENPDGTSIVMDAAKEQKLKDAFWTYIKFRGVRDSMEILQDEINRCGQDSMFASCIYEALAAGEKEGTNKPIMTVDWPGALNRLEKITERSDSIPKLEKKRMEYVNASTKLFADAETLFDVVQAATATPEQMLQFTQVRATITKNRALIKGIDELIERKRRQPKTDSAEASA